MPHYELLYPVRHDGVRYEPPAMVELSEDQAQVLLGAGVLAPAQQGKAEAPQGKKASDGKAARS